jgi:spermidine/putrescine transport system permease protein
MTVATGAEPIRPSSVTPNAAPKIRFNTAAGLVEALIGVGFAAALIALFTGAEMPLRAVLPDGGITAIFAALALIQFALAFVLIRDLRPAIPAARIAAVVSIAGALAYYFGTRDFLGMLAVSVLHGLVLILLTRRFEYVLLFPSLIWLTLFFMIPLFGVLVFSTGRGAGPGVVDMSSPSLENYVRILQPVGRSGLIYVNIFVRTVLIALLNTVICLLIGYPFAVWLARQPEKRRNALLLLVMIPFWTSILIRIYAWLLILRKDGILNDLLVDVLGVLDRPLELTATPFALMLGLVYGYLPFMILPLYTSIERLDNRLLEAANDLYANTRQAFLRVMLPLTLPGIIAGSILVFIPSVGTYIVTNVLGGGKQFLVGNLLEQQFIGASGDRAFGAAISSVLMVLMLMATLAYFRLGARNR